MKISVYDFLHRGYFPKELPPAFNTYGFALRYEEIGKKWNPIPSSPASESTKGSVYSITKGELNRRNLTLINPVSFLDLALYIDANIIDIQNVCKRSKYSESIPTYDINIKSRCYKPSSPSVLALMKRKLIAARNKKIEIKLDINNFYPSIYTHSITWAMVGKDLAKSIWRANGNKPIATPSNQDEMLYNIAYNLDVKIEHCQDKQTSGIPVGPDTSFIVAELLASYVDQKVGSAFPGITACRYYDDYSLFVSSREEAEAVVRYIQQVLGDLELSINEAKLEIKEAPCHFINDFAEELAPFKFDGQKAEKALMGYFNILFKLCELHPNRLSTIIRYGLKPLESEKLIIGPQTKELFESLLYKTALLDPSCLDQVCQLLSHRAFTPTKSTLEELIESIVSHHAPLNHHHEVAWSLWFCKKYSLTIGKDYVIKIFDMHNPVCTLVLLDVLNNNNTMQPLKSDPQIDARIKQIDSAARPEDLYGDEWILLYEGVRHGWLSNTQIVTGNPHFKVLNDNDVSFYDDNKDADYQSYDYIEKLPNPYPREMMKEAKEQRSAVFKETYDSLFEEIDDRYNLDEEDKTELKQKYKSISKSNEMEKNIYERILSQLFRRDEPDLEEYVDEVIRTLKEIAFY